MPTDDDPHRITIDARGHRCPVPTLRLRRALEGLQPGGVATVLADDPLARIDLPHFASANGHTLLKLVDEDGHLRALIRKGPPRGP